MGGVDQYLYWKSLKKVSCIGYDGWLNVHMFVKCKQEEILSMKFQCNNADHNWGELIYLLT